MIVFILLCTLIGWLVGHALIGLAVGLLCFLVVVIDELGKQGRRFR